MLTIFILNLWFVLYMMYKIAGKYREDFNEQHSDKIEKAKKKFAILKKVFKDSPESIELRR